MRVAGIKLGWGESESALVVDKWCGVVHRSVRLIGGELGMREAWLNDWWVGGGRMWEREVR
jgi:hypothetical protein